MFCSFFQIDTFLYKCTKCGIVIESEDSPIFPCLSLELSSRNPDLAYSIKNISDNEEVASDQTIENRFKICESCEFFDSGSCSKCGCLISRTKNYMNKLSSLDSKCPIDKW